MSRPAPGTTRYICPLECGWHHDAPPPSLTDLAGIAPEEGTRDLPEAINSVARQALLREVTKTEAAFRGHLDTHTTVEYVQAIQELRAEVARLSAPGNAP